MLRIRYPDNPLHLSAVLPGGAPQRQVTRWEQEGRQGRQTDDLALMSERADHLKLECKRERTKKKHLKIMSIQTTTQKMCELSYGSRCHTRIEKVAAMRKYEEKLKNTI